MKKLTLIIPAMLASVSVLAQGTVNFGNVGTGTAISNILTSAAVPAGTTFRAALYYLPDQAAMPTYQDFDERGVILSPSTTTFALAGQFVGGTRTTPATTPPGGTAWFQVRAWEVAFGNTYEAVLANQTPIGGRLGLAGTSVPVRVATGDQQLVGPGSLVTAGLRGFYVVPVPEPTVFALGALGIAALLFLRRRK
jgi:MYXO-CTERM domain-containing protein